MCGRYSLAVRPREARRRLQEESDMPSQDGPDDGSIRESYNFAPGYFGLVYRADTSDRGAGQEEAQQQKEDGSAADIGQKSGVDAHTRADDERDKPAYRLQAMKWGLVPFWTKRNPDYGSMMRTINCRDDSLATPGGMWNSMKQRKRCVVIAQGFYEWLKKDGGKTKLPHFVRRKDGQLMCFAGLWDCVQYEDAEDKLYTYTIITTDSNKQLHFLHDRMPVILDNGSEDMFQWLDSARSEWSNDLQGLLKPYRGDLECYPVSQDVGKVGNDSPSFIVPLDSAENKQNIVNFFGNQKKQASSEAKKEQLAGHPEEANETGTLPVVKAGEERETVDEWESEEDHALKPAPPGAGEKRKRGIEDGSPESPHQSVKVQANPGESPVKTPATSKKTRSATSNGTVAKASPKKGGSQKITSFFGK